MSKVIDLEESMGEIKDGIQGMVTKHDELSVRQDALEKYMRERFRSGLGVSVPGVEASKFSFSKSLYGIAFGDWSKSGYEKEVFAASRKALSTSTSGSGGGYIVPDEILAEAFIPLLRSKTVALQLGATMLSGLVGSPVRIPKQTGSGAVYWVGENAIIPKSDASFGDIQMTPKTMAMRAQYSNLLNLMANPAIEQLIRNDMASLAAAELDRVILRGPGFLNQPRGILNIPGIQTLALGANGADFTFESALDAIGLLEDANMMGAKVGFAFHPKVARKLKRTKIPQFSGDTAGAYVLPPTLSDARVQEMLGYSFGKTTAIPTDLTKGSGTNLSEVFVCSWEHVLVGMWGGLEILASNVAGDAWEQNAVEVRLIQNVDVQTRYPQSIVYINDAKTA